MQPTFLLIFVVFFVILVIVFIIVAFAACIRRFFSVLQRLRLHAEVRLDAFETDLDQVFFIRQNHRTRTRGLNSGLGCLASKQGNQRRDVIRLDRTQKEPNLRPGHRMSRPKLGRHCGTESTCNRAREANRFALVHVGYFLHEIAVVCSAVIEIDALDREWELIRPRLLRVGNGGHDLLYLFAANTIETCK